jgi:hypothetical protein
MVKSMKHIIPVIGVILLWLCLSTLTGYAESNPPLLPVVILQHSDGTQVWGRIVILSDDSLMVRRMDDFRQVAVNPQDVVRVYRVERKSSNLPLSILAGTLVMAGTWAAVVAAGDGKVTNESAILAGTIGAIPSVFVAVKVSNWTRKYRIEPLDVLGPEGTLNLPKLRRALE